MVLPGPGRDGQPVPGAREAYDSYKSRGPGDVTFSRSSATEYGLALLTTRHRDEEQRAAYWPTKVQEARDACPRHRRDSGWTAWRLFWYSCECLDDSDAARDRYVYQ